MAISFRRTVSVFDFGIEDIDDEDGPGFPVAVRLAAGFDADVDSDTGKILHLTWTDDNTTPHREHTLINWR